MDPVAAFLNGEDGTEVDLGLPFQQVDLIWQMGEASLAVNNGELVLPDFMGHQLSEDNIDWLKSRLR
jgi:hypothetical protein